MYDFQIDASYMRHHKPGSFGNGLNFQELYDNDFETAASEWAENYDLWRKGEHPDQLSEDRSDYKYYWQWTGVPPDEKYYRPAWTDEECVCFQMYETVSEGTPVSPVFDTKEELIEWMVVEGWSRESAVEFAKDGWAPSFIFTIKTGLVDGITGLGELKDHDKE